MFVNFETLYPAMCKEVLPESMQLSLNDNRVLSSYSRLGFFHYKTMLYKH